MIVMVVIVGFAAGFGGEELAESALGLLIVFYLLLIALALAANALLICDGICRYMLFDFLVPEKAIKYMLLSYMVPFAYPICLFLCRNSTVGVPVSEVSPPSYEPPATPDPF
jgi:hypothetical protein